jgi:ribosomal protein S18 acetylase RimI-like enzyme
MPLYQPVEANLRQAMRCYAHATPEGEARDYPGLTVTSSGIDFAVFNSAMLTEPLVGSANDLSRCITVADTHFAARGIGWSLWICDEMLPGKLRHDAPEILAESHLKLTTQAPGMFAEGVLPPRRAAADVECWPVSDARTRFDFSEVVSIVFAMPFALAHRIYGGARIWEGAMKGYIAYRKNFPVSVVCIVISAGVAGVYSLGTLPQHQRHGYAETLLRFALERAREETGIGASILQTTRAGINLYRRMGYRATSNFSIYVRESCGSLS